jgi:hypothetical protein
MGTVFSSHTQFTKYNSIKNKTPLGAGLDIDSIKIVIIRLSLKSYHQQ